MEAKEMKVAQTDDTSYVTISTTLPWARYGEATCRASKRHWKVLQFVIPSSPGSAQHSFQGHSGSTDRSQGGVGGCRKELLLWFLREVMGEAG